MSSQQKQVWPAPKVTVGCREAGRSQGCRSDIQEEMALSLLNSTSPACTSSPKPSRHIGAGLMESERDVGAIAPGGVGSWGHSP